MDCFWENQTVAVGPGNRPRKQIFRMVLANCMATNTPLLMWEHVSSCCIIMITLTCSEECNGRPVAGIALAWAIAPVFERCKNNCNNKDRDSIWLLFIFTEAPKKENKKFRPDNFWYVFFKKIKSRGAFVIVPKKTLIFYRSQTVLKTRPKIWLLGWRS